MKSRTVFDGPETTVSALISFTAVFMLHTNTNYVKPRALPNTIASIGRLVRYRAHRFDRLDVIRWVLECYLKPNHRHPSTPIDTSIE